MFQCALCFHVDQRVYALANRICWHDHSKGYMKREEPYSTDPIACPLHMMVDQPWLHSSLNNFDEAPIKYFCSCCWIHDLSAEQFTSISDWRWSAQSIWRRKVTEKFICLSVHLNIDVCVSPGLTPTFRSPSKASHEIQSKSVRLKKLFDRLSHRWPWLIMVGKNASWRSQALDTHMSAMDCVTAANPVPWASLPSIFTARKRQR